MWLRSARVTGLAVNLLTCALQNVTLFPPHRRSVALFRNFTKMAQFSASQHSRNRGQKLNLAAELPIAPHWRLGFSGPTGDDLFHSLRDWSATITAMSDSHWPHTGGHLQDEPDNLAKDGRISVGFVSSWFCNSAVGRLMLGLVRTLDRRRFVVHIFHVTSLSGKVRFMFDLSYSHIS